MAEKRFIDANGSYTLVATDNTGYGLCFGGGIISVINWHGSVVAEFYADDTPAADVVEVVHAEWIPSPDGINPIKCRRCGTVAPYRMELDFSHDIGLYPYKSNYCPNCGAKMDGERKERDNV